MNMNWVSSRTSYCTSLDIVFTKIKSKMILISYYCGLGVTGFKDKNFFLKWAIICKILYYP